MFASSASRQKTRLSILVRGARQAAYSQCLLQPVQILCKATPQIVNRVPSCKPCFIRSVCSSSERPVCNRWPILPASPRRFSSQSYEASAFLPRRCILYQKSTRSGGGDGALGNAPYRGAGLKELEPFPGRISVLPCWGRRSALYGGLPSPVRGFGFDCTNGDSSPHGVEVLPSRRAQPLLLCIYLHTCALTRDHETGGAAIARVARFEPSPCRSGPRLRLARRQASASALWACSPARHESRLRGTRTFSLLN